MIPSPRVVGRRGAVLIYLALVDLTYALSLWRPAPEAGRSVALRFVADVAPLDAWAALWLVVGVLCLAGAFVHPLDRIAFTAATAIKTLWGGVFLFGWLAGEVYRGWVSAAVWLALAVLVMIIAGWPDPVHDTRCRGR